MSREVRQIRQFYRGPLSCPDSCPEVFVSWPIPGDPYQLFGQGVGLHTILGNYRFCVFADVYLSPSSPF